MLFLIIGSHLFVALASLHRGVRNIYTGTSLTRSKRKPGDDIGFKTLNPSKLLTLVMLNEYKYHAHF